MLVKPHLAMAFLQVNESASPNGGARLNGGHAYHGSMDSDEFPSNDKRSLENAIDQLAQGRKVY